MSPVPEVNTFPLSHRGGHTSVTIIAQDRGGCQGNFVSEFFIDLVSLNSELNTLKTDINRPLFTFPQGTPP